MCIRDRLNCTLECYEIRIISLEYQRTKILYHSLVSLYTQEYEYHLYYSRVSLNCTLECYEIRNSRFALEHRYEDNNIDVGMNISTTESRLVSIDDDSQRGNDAESKKYLRSVENVLKELNLNELVTIKSKLPLKKAHRHFQLDSIDMIWNDATWNPEFMKKWWPRLKNDGGLLLLHNPIGNADDGERWCVASPTRTLKLAVRGVRTWSSRISLSHIITRMSIVSLISFVSLIYITRKSLEQQHSNAHLNILE